MAIVGRFPQILNYFSSSEHAQVITDYLSDALKPGTETNKRLHQLSINTFERFEISDGYYAVEQKFLSKERENCFIESHIKYIDIQVMVEGEEIIEVAYTPHLKLDENMVETRDLLTYHDHIDTHKILLKAGDVAVFFPEDAHMGTQIYQSSVQCVKTVVKMPVSFFRL